MNHDKDNERISAWVTKYALTDGIKVLGGEVCHNISSNMLSVDGWMNCFHGKDWHRTEAAAIAQAEDMRLKKIASLKKQITKLEKLSFGAKQ